MTPPTDRVPRRPRLAWLRILGAVLVGLAGLTVLAMLTSANEGSINLSHTRELVVLGLIFICGPLGAACLWTWWRLSGRYDTAANYVDKPSAFVVHRGPDPANPERFFAEGGYLYEIQVLPALAPLGFTRSETATDVSSHLLQDMYSFVTALAVSRFDRRVKVVVSRRLRAAAHFWHVVQVDFFDDEPAASARVTEIIATWDPAAYAALGPLTRSQLRAARRSPS